MTSDSKSTSDFSIELPETMYFDNNSSVFYIDDICVPHSWYTVEKDINDKLYLYVANVAGNPLSTIQEFSYVVTLTPNVYTGGSLAGHLTTILNASLKGPGKPLPSNNLENPFTALYQQSTNTIKITMSPTTTGLNRFNILSTKSIKDIYNTTNTQDCNELIGNNEIAYKLYSDGNDGFTGFVNLQPFRNLYMHSSALGNLSNIGPDGSQTVIKKIPVTSEFGNYIFDQTVMYNDYNSCSGQTLKKLDFQFKTSRGEVVPLHGLNVAFSIIFSRAQPDA
jgi:hypothetical protein